MKSPGGRFGIVDRFSEQIGCRRNQIYKDKFITSRDDKGAASLRVGRFEFLTVGGN